MTKPRNLLSDKYAERLQRNAQRKADLTAGTLAWESSANNLLSLLPVATTNYAGGELWVYEASDEELLRQGLAQRVDLPKPAVGCKTNRRMEDDLIKGYRMKDGRVRLTISAHLVRARDTRFAEFLAGVVGSAVVARAGL